MTAKTLANADNSSFTDFYTNTTLLNNAYREIYDILVNNSKAFIDRMEVTDDAMLPYDCYTILSVEDKNGNIIPQSTFCGNQIQGWDVENNVFIFPKGRKGFPITVTYATIPATITAPDKWIDVELPEDYQQATPQSVIYDKSTGKITVEEYADPTYLGKPVSWDIDTQEFTWNGRDFYDYISRQDYDGLDIPFTNVQVDSPYMAITYADRKVYVFTGWQGTEWNYNCIYGKETRGECGALTTNDLTGFGMLFHDDRTNSWKYAPFVPDTILSYPDNTLFAYMECRIAFQIASLLNMNTAFVKAEMDRAYENFYKNVGMSNNVRRINNQSRMKGLMFYRGSF